jgi:DNA-binding NarL/FixJ family response regulator
MAKVRADLPPPGPLRGLTEGERTLLDLISEGLTNRQISERMSLAEKTVKNYVSRLLAKLGLERAPKPRCWLPSFANAPKTGTDEHTHTDRPPVRTYANHGPVLPV